MNEDIIVIGIVFGSIVAIVVSILLYKLIKASFSSSTYDDEAFDRMAQAFIAYKKETEQRLEKLEAIVADKNQNSSAQQTLQQPEPKVDTEDQSTQEKNHGEKGKLKNILKE